MTEDEPSPRAELGWIAAQARGLLELDRMLGVASVPVPSLPRPTLARATAAPAAPVARPTPPTPAIADEGLVARRQANEKQLEVLARRMAGCTRCRLSEGRTNLVFGQGDAAAEVVFVGGGPGHDEDQQGLAFVGEAGELLTKMIVAMGVARDEVFIANVVRCLGGSPGGRPASGRPPEDRAPAPDELAACLPFLQEQLGIIKPKVICALGETAALGLGLIGPEGSLGESRGRFHDWRGTPVMVTYDPAHLLRNPADKRKAWEDLQQLFPHLSRRRA